MPVTKELTLPIERKGESEIRVGKIFKMFINRTSREGYDVGRDWLHWMFVFLPENERKVMNNRIKNSKEMEMPGVPKEKIIKAKEGLLKSLKAFSKKMDIQFIEMDRKKTPQEKNKILMEDQVSLEVCENAYKMWKERQGKLKEASQYEWFIMSFDEMYLEELSVWKKNLERKVQAGGNIEEMRPVADAILKNENEWKEINKILDRESQGKIKAEGEQKRTGVAVVFLGNIDDTVKVEFKKLLCKKRSEEQIEEDLEMVRLGKEYEERIIGELR